LVLNPGVKDMPLQIRRGTDAERLAMTQPLAQGELLFVSTPGAERLFIGNGVTLGGVQITGYTNEDAQDAAALLFSNGVHNGITFTYNDAAASLNAAVDLTNYQGSIQATAFKGSVFADDSTLLVDAIDGRLLGPLTGNVTGNVTGNTAGTHTGPVVGNVTGNVTGNLTGFHTGDVKGSVFGDDSTVLVNGVELTINLNGTVKSNIIPGTTATFDIGSAANQFDDVYAVNIKSASDQIVLSTATKTATLAQINLESSGLITGPAMIATVPSILYATTAVSATDPWPNLLTINTASAATNSLGLTRSRGTLVTPATVINGDEIGSISVNGHDGTGFVASAEIVFQVNNTVSTGVIPSKMDFNVSSAAGVVATKMSVKATDVAFSVPPMLPVVANDTARTALVPTPATGMMIFMTSGTSPAATNKVQVYDSTAWVNLP
jgi:hypothetical protein